MIIRFLIVANVLVYLWEMATGATSSNLALYTHGALVPAAVLQDHEWWRVITSGFLHANLLHIGVNMVSLWMIGNFVETTLGSPKTLLLYAISLVLSGVAVVYFSDPMVPTLGASGAIFGLFGSIFAVGLKHGRPGWEFIKANIPILALNLAFTFFMPGISKAGHVGGLIAGFLATLVLYFPPKPVYAAVTDTRTGEGLESVYESPNQT